MTPSQALLNAMAAAIAASVPTLAEATPFVMVSLVKTPFTPAPDLDIGTLDFANYNGAAGLHANSAATQVFTDPATGDTIIQVRTPAGGWHWVAADAVSLPQTVYGYVLTDSAGAVLWGSALFDVPIVVNTAGQGIDIGDIRFALSQGALT